MTNAAELLSHKEKKSSAQDNRSSLFVGSVEKCFFVLNAFHQSKRPLSLTEVALKTGLGKSAAQRFCYALVEMGYLEREADSRRMFPSAKLMEFSYTFLRSDPVNTLAAPHLLRARETCGQAVNLALPMDQDVIYVARLPSFHSSIVSPIVGGRAPMFCTASGRAYLSTLPDKERAKILKESDIRNLTPHTITDNAEILRRINDVSNKGYTIAVQECIIGEISIGAPIFGAGRQGVGAINICVTMPNWTVERVEAELAPIICQTAHDITVALAN
ncbi:IclR family transcriptional regulator [Amylibacter ulvae]|uniref:IclR family transcriptional regulator n=1 Tax=Paramylibacter ulvae TaxID=1651968 RepID=A0ABQ3D1N2_9RHOB|nr:IclR family transcriptional regulator C-terminal domain-containing protein [Amylibacter ulvae]GHA48860.1 IclR family transcriptional regulator [Amylibacter ulvae]